MPPIGVPSGVPTIPPDRDRERLVDRAGQIIEDKPHVGVGIPVRPDLRDIPSAAADRVGAGFRHDAGLEVVVDVDRTVVGRQLERADAVVLVPRPERMVGNDARIGAGRRDVQQCSPVMVQLPRA